MKKIPLMFASLVMAWQPAGAQGIVYGSFDPIADLALPRFGGQVGWPAVVGAQYQVLVNTNLTTTNWVNTGGIISARLTNVVTQVTTSGSKAFYRIVQLP